MDGPVYDPGAAYELINAPDRYPPPQDDAEGVWRSVLDDKNEPIAVIWTDNSMSTGIRWIEQTDPVLQAFKDISRYARIGAEPGTAYRLALKTPGLKVGDEQSGSVLMGTNDAMSIMMGTAQE